MQILHIVIIAALAAMLCGCIQSRSYEPAIGEGFVAPMTLNLREEIAPRAAVTATVKHGERLEVLQRRRRFAKVRTAQGLVGWTDGRQLLSSEGMARLQHSNERARRIPSQGKAMPFDALNVHISPNRTAPIFYQLPEDARVDLVGRAVKTRTQYIPDQDPAKVTEPPDAIRDDWSLVRLSDQRSGWVLSRMLMLDLPDEVTQFAEGHRITSFFPLGSQDSKPSYLWTTIAVPPEHYQFDSIRVFVWNPRRRRYETVFRESNLTGYYPVMVEPGPQGVHRIRLLAAPAGGSVEQRIYEFRNQTMRQILREPWARPVDDPTDNLPVLLDAAEETFWTRMRDWFSSLRRR